MSADPGEDFFQQRVRLCDEYKARNLNWLALAQHAREGNNEFDHLDSKIAQTHVAVILYTLAYLLTDSTEAKEQAYSALRQLYASAEYLASLTVTHSGIDTKFQLSAENEEIDAKILKRKLKELCITEPAAHDDKTSALLESYISLIFLENERVNAAYICDSQLKPELEAIKKSLVKGNTATLATIAQNISRTKTVASAAPTPAANTLISRHRLQHVAASSSASSSSSAHPIEVIIATDRDDTLCWLDQNQYKLLGATKVLPILVHAGIRENVQWCMISAGSSAEIKKDPAYTLLYELAKQRGFRLPVPHNTQVGAHGAGFITQLSSVQYHSFINLRDQKDKLGVSYHQNSQEIPKNIVNPSLLSCDISAVNVLLEPSSQLINNSDNSFMIISATGLCYTYPNEAIITMQFGELKLQLNIKSYYEHREIISKGKNKLWMIFDMLGKTQCTLFPESCHQLKSLGIIGLEAPPTYQVIDPSNIIVIDDDEGVEKLFKETEFTFILATTPEGSAVRKKHTEVSPDYLGQLHDSYFAALLRANLNKGMTKEAALLDIIHSLIKTTLSMSKFSCSGRTECIENIEQDGGIKKIRIPKLLHKVIVQLNKIKAQASTAKDGLATIKKIITKATSQQSSEVSSGFLHHTQPTHIQELYKELNWVINELPSLTVITSASTSLVDSISSPQLGK